MTERGWWATRVRQFRSHVRARVSDREQADLASWLTPAQADLFGSMPPADQRHGLDVAATLRAEGSTDPELLLAGLLHDAGKGRGIGLWHRVAWSLGERYGAAVWRMAALLPGFGSAFDRLRDHAELSARLAEAAGCTLRTVELIRYQAEPIDQEAGLCLRLADDAN